LHCIALVKYVPAFVKIYIILLTLFLADCYVEPWVRYYIVCLSVRNACIVAKRYN